MKYCFYYDGKARNLPKVDEVILKYKKNTPDLIRYCQEADENVRVIADLTVFEEENITYDILTSAASAHKNFAVLLDIEHQMDIALTLRESMVKVFFTYICDTWDKLFSCILAGASDVYVCGELAFSMKKVHGVCSSRNVQVRVFPNVCQLNSKVNNLNKVTSFFIRPEDLQYYEDYIDVIEFFGSMEKQSVLFDIYKEHKGWKGDVNELILDCGPGMDVPNRNIWESFGKNRVDCGKGCNYNKCTLCYDIFSLAKTIEKKKLEREEADE